ncbi:MAG TPA: Gfo/Idh/MocA family oxidoreductase [Friedmanniella sp.]
MAAFRFAVLGTGRGARAFALGLRASERVEVGAVGSRSTERAGAFAASLGLDCPVGDHRQALEQPVDAVYIATPPSTHHALALQSLRAGRPVLVEKPFTTDAAQAREVVAEADRLGLFCMEALWTRFLPLVREVDTLLAGGAIGEVLSVTGSFGSDRADAAHLRDPALGGGALLDRGVYPLSFVIRTLGRPVSVAAEVVTGPSGVDEECAAVLRHGRGGLSTVHASFRGELANDVRYVGSQGSLWVRGPVYRPVSASLSKAHASGAAAAEPTAAAPGSGLRSGLTSSITDAPWAHGLRQVAGLVLPRAARTRSLPLVRPYRGNGYHYQAEEVERCVRLGLRESPVMPTDESVAVLETVDLIRAAAGADQTPAAPDAAPRPAPRPAPRSPEQETR